MNRFNSLEFRDDGESRLEAASVRPDEAFHFERASAAFADSDFEQALRAYSKVLEFNPQNSAAWTGQVRALIELGEFHEAKVWADKALERFPTAPDLLAAKAVALGRLGDTKAALAFSDASMEERGETPYLWLARGDVLLACQEKRAAACFEKALLLAPGDWLVRWLAARIHAYYRKFTTALRFAQEALQWNPAGVSVWLETGHCQLALGLHELALHSFQQARELSPAHEHARAALLQLARRGWWDHLRGFWRRLFP